MNDRIIGFDLARAYAIFGMFIVNYNFSFGSMLAPTNNVDRFLRLFTGNSTAIFIICAGMGVILMSRNHANTLEEKAKLKAKIMKRSWFLFILGLLLYNWWEGDILHFYGGYMHIVAFMIFLPKRYFFIFALLTLVVHNVLQYIIPIDKGWNFDNYDYQDFWTPIGFVRNTLYNGWNSIFPWFSYFLVGMWLGHLDWRSAKIKLNIFVSGLILFTTIQIIRYFAMHQYFDDAQTNFIMAEYFPPFLPFILVTMGFALMMISTCMFIGERFHSNKLILALQKTGQMTLTHYIFHITAGVIIFCTLTGKKFENGLASTGNPVSSLYILLYSLAFFIVCVGLSVLWSQKFKNGPVETIMRRISG
jgi:uncharacterized protein